MLRWPMAANAPSAIEAMATNTTICCHCVDHARKRHDGCAHEHGDAGDLGRGGEEGGDRRRRALIDVGRPHMERHRRDLEAEAGEQENEPEHQAQMSGTRAALGRRLGDAGKAHRAGEAVDQRRAVKQHARGQGAQDEIFEPRLGRAHGIAIDGGDHVEREAHQLEPEIERDQVGRRDEHHHAGGRQQDQDRIFEPLPLLGREIIGGHQDRRRRSGQRQKLEEAGEAVDDEAAAEGDELARRQPDNDGAGEDQQQDRRAVDALAACSPRNAPTISSAMAPSASTISGRAGSSAGISSVSGIDGLASGQCASKAAAFAAPSARS